MKVLKFSLNEPLNVTSSTIRGIYKVEDLLTINGYLQSIPKGFNEVLNCRSILVQFGLYKPQAIMIRSWETNAHFTGYSQKVEVTLSGIPITFQEHLHTVTGSLSESMYKRLPLGMRKENQQLKELGACFKRLMIARAFI